VVESGAELLAALAQRRPEIEVRGTLAGLPAVTLPAGVRLRGGTLVFNARGVRLTSDNELTDVTVQAAEHEIAIGNDTSVESLGTLALHGVRVTGQVLLVADRAVRSGHVLVRGLHVTGADVRGREHRPRLVGVDALPGAVTVWNRQPDPEVVITADLVDVSAGTAETPVRGSGVMVGGHGDWERGHGGLLRVSALRTGEVHTDGGIAAGTADLISGGVMVIPGGEVAEVVNDGPVTTRGQNDMALDNSGEVTAWTAHAPVTTHGPSGIGFVNFGGIDRLDVRAPIQTYGTGARGFNFYDGALRHASFHSIATHGDGSIGIQISRHLPALDIAGDLVTYGGEGQSLVRGVQVTLKAIALSVKADGHVKTATVGGNVHTAGDDVVTIEVEGRLDRLQVRGEIGADGQRSDAVHLRGSGPDLDGLTITANGGFPVVRPS
jgi:hypothetical protein